MVNDQRGLTVMKILREGEVRLRMVSPLCPADGAHPGGPRRAVPSRGASRL